jgi:hypothetical protein
MLRQDRIDGRAQPHKAAAHGERFDLEWLNEIVWNGHR